ncbi:host attachment family protein [Leisingera aquaemixtae]|jgi:protein required for attachment to host cells|uniref:Host attachment family protein n=1 Tax=Leisingera aquaemixtae TaxID=1396826 RepID=A0A0P1HCS6_9RHOB|nr:MULTISPECIES: host attachment family protein [Leisingera]UWQ26289.1 host attachment family protein [Leisingera aquaemixtae]UWQ38809.1 host attachment family protein [Leisingera aquaemixtae]UWQ42910.1 host attachment family protein [Leisingera aquaemixtae]UWQ47234.1 host attachment family protein [Leisingera aquaemixtae]CUI01094.1 Protein required for attachment to host cells [Leisingera aquaemixtae]
MTFLTQGTWVLVADSEKALFLENTTDAQNPNLKVRRKDEQENPSNREQSANRPGRFNDGPSVHRSAVDDTDWHQLAKERFASDLADRLYKMAHKGQFERLVLVAAPEVLGELRKNLHKEVADRVVAEVAKNLTNHETSKIEEMVKDALENG